MVTDSYETELVIDTPEKARNLEELFESGVCWTRGDTKIVYGDADDDLARRFIEKYSKKR